MISPLYDGSSLTNAVLGRHNTGLLRFIVCNVWEELNFPLNQNSTYRSREIQIFSTNYDTGMQGNLEACSINIFDFRTLTVSPNTYVSVQIGININQFGSIEVQNEGNLLMVKDRYNGFCGPDLINLGPNGIIT